MDKVEKPVETEDREYQSQEISCDRGSSFHGQSPLNG
jgi:hypothetical protein